MIASVFAAPGQIGTMEEAHSGGRPSASSNGGRRRSDPSDTPGDGSDGTAIHASNGPSEGRGNPRGSGSGKEMHLSSLFSPIDWS